MSFRLSFLLLIPIICAAQSPEANAQRMMLDELKGIRAALERIEISQRAILTLTRLQIDESRVAALEAERSRLALREDGLRKETAVAARASEAQEQVGQPDGSSQVVASSQIPAARAQTAQASAALREVSISREALDQQIGRLKERIAQLQKAIDDAAR